MRYSIVLLGLFCMFLSSCGGGKAKTPEASQEEFDKSRSEMKEKMEREITVFGNEGYILQSFVMDGTETTLDAEHPVTIIFFGSNMVVGNCRSFRGKANVEGDSQVAFSGLTYMKPRHDDGCPILQVELETNLFDAFGKASTFTISEEGVVVLTGGNIKLTFGKK